MCSTECSHLKLDKSSIKEKSFSYCPDCGNTAFKGSQTQIYYTIKPTRFNGQIDFSPKEIFKNIKQEKIEPSIIYRECRLNAIEILQQKYNIYTKYYKINDQVFYLALHYMDLIFKKATEKISRRSLCIYAITCLILAAKFNEYDIPLVNNERFLSNDENITVSDLVLAEIDVLRKLNYKLTEFTCYDLVNFLMYNGIIYSEEIKRSSQHLNLIYCYFSKIFKDIMLSNICLDFTPLQIAFSLLHAVRKKFKLGTKFEKLTKMFYNVHKNDYISCFNVVIVEIEGNESPLPGKMSRGVRFSVEQNMGFLALARGQNYCRSKESNYSPTCLHTEPKMKSKKKEKNEKNEKNEKKGSDEVLNPKKKKFSSSTTLRKIKIKENEEKGRNDVNIRKIYYTNFIGNRQKKYVRSKSLYCLKNIN